MRTIRAFNQVRLVLRSLRRFLDSSPDPAILKPIGKICLRSSQKLSSQLNIRFLRVSTLPENTNAELIPVLLSHILTSQVMIKILRLEIPQLRAVLIIPLPHLVIHIIILIHQRMSIIRTRRIRILEVHSHQINSFPKISFRFQLSRDKIAHVSPSPILNFLNVQLSKEHHEINPVHLLISLKLLQQFRHTRLILFINEPIDGLSHL